jgi:hypothetical protein
VGRLTEAYLPSYMLWTRESGLTDRKLSCSSSQPHTLVHRSFRPFPRQKAPARDCVPVTWLFNAQPSSSCTSKVVPAQDECRGLLYPCWHVSFNIIMRPASHILLLCMSGSSTHSLQPGNTVAHKKRAAVFHPRAMYCFQTYLAYALYPAPYIPRPIITFNDLM